MRPQAIVMDVEGTTSSIRFVKDILFVYAEQFLPEFIRENKDERDVARQLRSMSDKTGIAQRDTEGLIAQLLEWMREDKKVTELKMLQGMVWERGYKQGEYQAHIYPDVPARLAEWLDKGINLYVYSSGSEKAQRLFFRYTTVGDLRLHFAGHFDTTLGPKQDSESYVKLAESVALPPEEMVFISDVEAELDAAAEAGMKTYYIVRKEESDLDPAKVRSPHTVVGSFADIHID